MADSRALKFLCASCSRLVDVERFRLEGTVLVVTCTACGAENTAGAAAAENPPAPPPPPKLIALRTPTVEAISRAASAASADPFVVPEGHCPKCIARRLPGALSCPSCGLTFGQADVQTFAPSEWLREQWLALLQAWGDDAHHESLRSQAMGKSELAELGRLYRLRLAEVPEDPYAMRGRDEVLRLAVLPSISVRQATKGLKPSTWKYFALSAVIAACMVVLFLLVRTMLTPS